MRVLSSTFSSFHTTVVFSKRKRLLGLWKRIPFGSGKGVGLGLRIPSVIESGSVISTLVLFKIYMNRWLNCVRVQVVTMVDLRYLVVFVYRLIVRVDAPSVILLRVKRLVLFFFLRDSDYAVSGTWIFCRLGLRLE